MKSGATCIAYETVTSRSGQLPLLKPMSEVAGRMAIQVGAHYLEKEQGGRGVLLGRRARGRPGARSRSSAAGSPGSTPRRWRSACAPTSPSTTSTTSGWPSSTCSSAARSRPLMRRAARSPMRSTKAELVIGAVLVPGAAAPKLVTREMLKTMKRGSRAGRHRDRPGRLLRDQPCDDPRRPGLRGRRDHPLLRRQHARRGVADQRLRLEQCDPAVRAQDRQSRAPTRR